MTESMQICQICNRSIVMTADGRVFLTGVTERDLPNRCHAVGHKIDLKYAKSVSVTR